MVALMRLKSVALHAFWSILLVAALGLVPRSAAAQYALQPGDTLEISVTGIPEFRERAPIGLDGQIGLPLVGRIKVAGLSVADARAKIAAGLANKVYRQSTADGREVPHLILGGGVIVTVAEYRPIYVTGDVAKPGGYPFRPGMTVRQAIAVAGGYDAVRFRVANPFLQTADLLSHYQTLWLELASEQARLWRLRTELGENATEASEQQAPTPTGIAERLMKAETAQLVARQEERQKDRALLRDAMTKATNQLKILAQKKEKDEEGYQADAADLQKARGLFRKGLTVGTRLSEARRAALLASDQLLQTIVQMSNVERQRDEYARRLDQVDSQYRIKDLQDLKTTTLRLAQITARLQSTGKKLMYVGLSRSQLGQGAERPPEITVHRTGEDGWHRVAAGEDLALAPGDVVDVALSSRGVDKPAAGSQKGS